MVGVLFLTVLKRNYFSACRNSIIQSVSVMQSYEEFMSSGKHDVHEIIAFKRLMAGRKDIKSVPVGLVNNPQPYSHANVKNFEIPLVKEGETASMKDGEIRDLLDQCSGLSFLEMVSFKVAGKDTIAKNMFQNFAVGYADNLAGTCIQTCMSKKGAEGSEEEFKEITAKINDYYYGGGTLRGLMKRWSVGLGRKGIRRVDMKLDEAERNYVYKVLPFDKTKMLDLRGKNPSECHPAMNYQSAAGAPWFDPKDRVFDHIEEIFEGAISLYQLAVIGYKELKTFLEVDHRENGLVLLKNKRELSLRDEAFDKARPYFVYPGSLRMLFTIIMDSYSLGRMNAFQNSNSISAIGFSWYYGGATDLMSWIASRKAKGVGAYFLSYGDDQLWVIVCENGDVVYTLPDVKHMDMALCKNTLACGAEKVLKDMAENLDKAWYRLGVLYGHYMSNCQILVHHGLVVRKEGHSLNSGVNGTTDADMVGSARITYRAEGMLRKCKDHDDVVKRLSGVRRAVMNDLNLDLKESTLTTYLFDPERMELDGAFLGMKIRRVTVDGLSGLVPVPDMEKFGANLYYSKVSKNDKMRLSKLMSKCIGLCASGGFVNNLFYNVCRRMYETYRALEYKPLQGELTALGGTAPDSLIEYISMASKESMEFPTRRWFMALFLSGEDAVDARRQVVVSEPGNLEFTAEEEALLKELELEPSDNWIDIDRRAGREVSTELEKKMSGEVVAPQVEKRKAHLIPPNYKQRARKLERMRKRAAERRRLAQEQINKSRAHIRGRWGDNPDLEENAFDEDFQHSQAGLQEEEVDFKDASAEEQRLAMLEEEWRRKMDSEYDEKYNSDEEGDFEETKEQTLERLYGNDEFFDKYDLGGLGGYGDSG